MILKLLIFTILNLSIFSKLIVNAPKQLVNNFDEGQIDAALANFGMYKYGHTITGILIIGPLAVQDPKKNPEKQQISKDGCLDMVSPYYTNREKKNLPFFLMVERGNCKMLEKAKHASEIGASLLIIADNKDEDINTQLIVGHYEDLGAPHLQMPTIMISKQSAQLITDQYDKNEGIINLSFKMEHPNRTDGNVQVELYFQPYERESFEFLLHFNKVFHDIGSDKITFYPRYYTWYCIQCKKVYNFKTQDDHGECVSGGRYCAYDPDVKGPITGADVVNQMVKSLCTFEVLGQTSWIKIQLDYYRQCIQYSSLKQSLDQCFETIFGSFLDEYKPDDKDDIYNKYQKCYDQSWIEQSGVDQRFWDNRILQEQKEIHLQNDVTTTPQLVVNQMKFYGDLEETEATEEIICEAFTEETKPDFCKLYIDPRVRDQPFLQASQFDYGFLFLVVLIAILVILIFLWFLQRSIKKNYQYSVQAQIEEEVHNYFNMNQQ